MLFGSTVIAGNDVDSLNYKTSSVKESKQSQFEQLKIEKLESLGAVIGSPDYASTGYGYRLELKDGSSVSTTWSVTLCGSDNTIPCKVSTDIADASFCEPSVLALARFTPDGNQFWEKGYLERHPVKGDVFLCNPKSWWFSTYAKWVNFPNDLAASPLYLLPDDKTIVINPKGRELFYINADTGESVGYVGSDIVVIDGEEIRKIKKMVDAKISTEIPYTVVSNSVSSVIDHHLQPEELQKSRTKRFFQIFDQAIFDSKKSSTSQSKSTFNQGER